MIFTYHLLISEHWICISLQLNVKVAWLIKDTTGVFSGQLLVAQSIKTGEIFSLQYYTPILKNQQEKIPEMHKTFINLVWFICMYFFWLHRIFLCWRLSKLSMAENNWNYCILTKFLSCVLLDVSLINNKIGWVVWTPVKNSLRTLHNHLNNYYFNIHCF